MDNLEKLKEMDASEKIIEAGMSARVIMTDLSFYDVIYIGLVNKPTFTTGLNIFTKELSVVVKFEDDNDTFTLPTQYIKEIVIKTGDKCLL